MEENNHAEQEIPINNNKEPITEQDMEVHHHSHDPAAPHHKKNWKAYFWEFFMLFLAVFCGSLAELQLEHYIEHQRENKFAQTLLVDLINDTLDLTYDLNGWSKTKTRTDTIIMELEKSNETRDHRLLYKSVSPINTNNTFLYHDRTIQQLKSAGNFRLLRNNAIADSLVDYDSWILTTVKNIEELYSMSLSPELLTLENQLFNVKYFKIVKDQSKLDEAFSLYPEKIIMQKGKEDIKFQFYNKIHNYKSLTESRMHYLGTSLRRAKNLITLLKKEYHLD